MTIIYNKINNFFSLNVYTRRSTSQVYRFDFEEILSSTINICFFYTFFAHQNTENWRSAMFCYRSGAKNIISSIKKEKKYEG